MKDQKFRIDRRMMMVGGVALVGAGLTRSASAISQMGQAPQPIADNAPLPAPAPQAITAPSTIHPKLFRGALDALAKHSASIPNRGRIAIVDFSSSSSDMRLHFLDVVSGEMSRLLVAHGSGSDPRHTGFLQKFSNEFNSNASSEGAFLTSNYYVGKHGRSQRLIGLDPTNNNALDRAIVVHGAWYANADMIQTHGKLGRSQGCFAVGESDLDKLFGYLGEGSLIYAAKA